MRSAVSIPEIDEHPLEELPVDVFELTSEGLEIESLTGAMGFTGRTGCCCTTGSSSTCTPVGGQCFC